MSIILFCVSGMMYYELRHQVHEKNELEMRNAITRLVDVVDDLQTDGAKAQAMRGRPDTFEGGPQFSWRAMADGKTVTASAKFPVPAAAFSLSQASGKLTTWTGTGATGPQSYLLSATQLAAGSHGAVLLQVAMDISQDQQILDKYGMRLASALLFAVAFSGVAGWFLAQRGLAPLRAMNHAMDGVSVDKLQVRIANKTWPAELQELAVTFDGMLARLESSFEQLSRFSSDLAHEFRSPINNLVAAASVTLTRPRNASEYQHTLEVIVEEGDRLSRMVSSMLFLARADNAKQWLAPEFLDLGVEFQKLLDFFDAVAEEQGVRISAHGAVELHADPLLLRRALSNLIANSLRHTASGGSIDIRALENGQFVILSVTDSGQGIAAEHLPHLFERFYRIDAARSGSESTGLGLAVVKSIVELHGGSVAIESTFGVGTTVSLRFSKSGSSRPSATVLPS